MIRKAFKHFLLITKHKIIVFKLCFKAGIIWRGIVHDLSKYFWVEFSEGVKYYQGNKSPNGQCKQEKGYSEAWLNHKGRNRHHHEYWYDYLAPNQTPVIPYKYTVELICDNLAAGIIYEGKNWTSDFQYKYWTKRKDKFNIHHETNNFIETILADVAKHGINRVINKKYLSNKYKKIVINNTK